MSTPDSKLSPIKRAYLALEKMQARIDVLERAKNEPIAIVGMGCRFPGDAADPESFWRLLREGTDATREVPADRWAPDRYPESDGGISSRRGGFLDGVDLFDPA